MLFFLTIIFVAVVFYLAKVVVMQLEQTADEDIMRAKDSYERIIEQKNKILAEKSNLEREAAQIFTLYEMTREITRHFNEQEAFNIFKTKVKENLGLEDCRMVEELKEKEVPPGYQTFVLNPLRGPFHGSKEQTLGYLLYKGVASKDQAKFAILAHQFALAFRRIKLYREVETLAITDALTGVYTRRYFLERFEEEIKRAGVHKTKIAFLMADVDHFKKVNDQHGHLAGDEALKAVGMLLKENIREIDIAGRYGGEEFCVVLPETDAPGARLVAERIRQSVEQKVIKAYDATLRITISIGISAFPADGKLMAELIDKADWALYRAKSQGRNAVVAFGQYANSK